jgi:hypothetical protein
LEPIGPREARTGGRNPPIRASQAADYAFGFNPPYGLRADFSYFFSRTLGLLLFFGHKLADLLVTASN